MTGLDEWEQMVAEAADRKAGRKRAMPERWRSSAARELAAAVRAAGGTVERVHPGPGSRITGPGGVITIHEPSGGTRRDLRRDSAARKIADATGLEL